MQVAFVESSQSSHPLREISLSTTLTSSTPSFIQRLNAFRERFGAKAAIYKSIDVVLSKVFRVSVHAVVWLDLKSLAKLAPPDPQFTFRFLTADEVAKYAQDPSYYLDSKLAEGVRGGNEVCFAALAGDRLAAIACYSLDLAKPDHTAGATFSFPADAAYMSYGHTHPDFRGARLHGLVMGLALEEFSKRGITKLVSIVGWTNWASLKSCYRLGYVNLGNMFTIGGRDHAVGIYPKRAKQLGVRFGRKAVKRVL
jgi:hypothetical protein